MADEEDDAVLKASMRNLDLGSASAPAGHDAGTSQDGFQPSRPRAAPRTSTRTRDITREFTQSAARLKTGELVRDEMFSLFDAVGALEIMDPKMDSGYLEPGDTLEDDYDVAGALEPPEVLGIMDALLEAEVAWHMGHPLSQTLFTSVYLDYLLWPEPGMLEDATFSRNGASTEGNMLVHVVLRSYCLALVKTCDHVHKLITAESYYEEEDFVSNLFNRSLLSRFSADDICVLVDNAITAVTAVSDDMTAEIREGLLSRLKYRVAFLRAVVNEPREMVDQGGEYWKLCLELLSPIESSHALAVFIDRSFSTKVQRKLASTIPPRPIIRFDFGVCTTFLRQLFQNAIDAAGVLRCPRVSGIITFLHIFLSQKPQPAVYVRCLLQAMIIGPLRGPKLEKRREFFLRELEEIVLPSHVLTDRSNGDAEHPQDARYKIWQRMGTFVEQVCEPFFDILRALCMNRSRARRMLCNLLYEWDGLQLDLEDLDNEMRDLTDEQPVYDDAWELPLSSWGFFYKLRQMQWIILLGFELQMYHSDEWSGMYCYLLEVADHRRTHVERIFNFLHHRANRRPRQASPPSAELAHSMEFLALVAEEASATVALAETFACLYHALALLDLLPPAPPPPYGSTKLRHYLRLRPFLPLCLPVLQSASEPFTAMEKLAASLPVAAEHQKLPASQRQALALLDAADAAGRRARKSWDSVSKASAAAAGCVGCEDAWRQGVKDILRRAVMAGITGARVRKWVVAGCAAGELAVDVHAGVLDDDMPGGPAAAWIVPQARSP